MKQLITESKIVSFCKNLNKNIILYFYNSATYRIFITFNKFFRNTVLKGADESIFVKTAKKVAAEIKVRDIGLFVILVVMLNTLVMLAFRKEIDVFSICARIFFLLLGVILYVRNMRIR